MPGGMRKASEQGCLRVLASAIVAGTVRLYMESGFAVQKLPQLPKERMIVKIPFPVV